MKNSTRQTTVSIVLLITALAQFFVPFLSVVRTESSLMNPTDNVQITPATYAFSIWGLITSLSLLFAIWQVLPKNRNNKLYQEIRPYLISVYIGFSLWLFAAVQEWIWLTLLIFIGMLLALWKAYSPVVATRKTLSLVEKVTLDAQLGIYTAWSSVAVFANVAAVLYIYGVSDLGLAGIIWQGLILIGAAVSSIYGIYKTKAGNFYTATILWAFIAVYFGLTGEAENTFELQIVTLIAIMAILSSYLYFKKSTK